MEMQMTPKNDGQAGDGPDDPVRRLVRIKLESLGVSAKAASERLGRNHAYLQQFLERGVPRSLPEDAREALASIIGVAPEDLRGPSTSRTPRNKWQTIFDEAKNMPDPPGVATIADRPGGSSLATPEIVRTLAALPHDVPVRGTARGDNDGKGDFAFNGEVAGYVRRLPGLSGVKDAFALYVQGSSMSPWREEGGLVYINPHRPARVGDHVVVEMRPTQDGEPGVVWLKKLIGRSPDGSLTLAQYNPRNDRIKLAGTKVLRVLRVAEWEELIL
jgi:phage repressor protein C with HTH and peptisase S24 domain